MCVCVFLCVVWHVLVMSSICGWYCVCVRRCPMLLTFRFSGGHFGSFCVCFGDIWGCFRYFVGEIVFVCVCG